MSGGRTASRRTLVQHFERHPKLAPQDGRPPSDGCSRGSNSNVGPERTVDLKWLLLCIMDYSVYALKCVFSDLQKLRRTGKNIRIKWRSNVGVKWRVVGVDKQCASCEMQEERWYCFSSFDRNTGVFADVHYGRHPTLFSCLKSPIFTRSTPLHTIAY